MHPDCLFRYTPKPAGDLRRSSRPQAVGMNGAASGAAFQLLVGVSICNAGADKQTMRYSWPRAPISAAPTIR